MDNSYALGNKSLLLEHRIKGFKILKNTVRIWGNAGWNWSRPNVFINDGRERLQRGSLNLSE